MYGEDVELKLNDVVEVVGVLSRCPELAAAHLQPADQASAQEWRQAEVVIYWLSFYFSYLDAAAPSWQQLTCSWQTRRAGVVMYWFGVDFLLLDAAARAGSSAPVAG